MAKKWLSSRRMAGLGLDAAGQLVVGLGHDIPSREVGSCIALTFWNRTSTRVGNVSFFVLRSSSRAMPTV
jgi:hypothetical protein